MELHLKVITGLERLAEVFKSLLWEKAKLHGISPIQIQILLFISNHETKLCNVSCLAKEFNVTKPTISDAVRVLLKKNFVEKDLSPIDNRRYNLILSAQGTTLISDLYDYATPVSEEIEGISKEELGSLFGIISKLIYQLNQKGIIQVQRTCYGCKFYEGNRLDQHHCLLMNKDLINQEIRLDCPEFEVK